MMVRVRKDNPCPICGRGDWCLVAPDKSAAICPRVESGRYIDDSGYLHRLCSAKTPTYTTLSERKTVPAEIPILARQYQTSITGDRLQQTAESIHVSIESLKRLRCGWDGQAVTFPMQDDQGHIVGIRRRFDNGVKLCVPGSKNGLFVPDGLTGENPLLVVEGNTDAAAGLDLGFDCIGRPSCLGGVKLIQKYLRIHRYEQVVIIPDFDQKDDGSNPGLAGGQRLQRELQLYCRDVRLVVPPPEYNDLRVWVWAGLTRDELLQRIDTEVKI